MPNIQKSQKRTPVRYPEMTRQSVGKLTVDVFTRGALQPIDEAKVTIRKTGAEGSPLEVLSTNISGQTPTINLEAPPLELSLEPSTERPYSDYTLEIEAPGFDRVVIEGAQILSNSSSIQEVRLPLQRQLTRQPEIIGIPPHTLYGDYPPKIPEDPVKPEPAPTGFVVLDQPVIPEYVIVHDGVPDNPNAANYYIRFKDYIKNVASSEIYSTWPESTIQSNVLAILSFTLNRVFTEWYRGKGKNFTITSSTAYDHKFMYGRNIYQEISQIVDTIFTNYISRPGIRQPLLTQYCDGVKVECPTWMTQWGSKNLGDQGLTALEILRSFYGSNIFISTAEKVAGVPSSYPGFNLQIGSSGAPVRTIQQQLNAIANNFPAIPKVRVDGNYGAKTKEAVETFQQIFNLPSTGIVDYPTWYKISDIYVGVTKIAELV